VNLALVSTPAAAESLLAHLESHFDLRLFVELGREGGQAGGLRMEPVDALFPREHDQILFALENTAEHGFALPLIRLLGGAVVLPEWELGHLTRAAFPELAEDGLGGRLRALREGRSFNRSVVRWADAFLVPDEDLRARILEDRNAPTPIAVVAGAEGYVEPLQSFPRPRGARKRLFWQRVRRAAREISD
jgi:hypothetical protein